MEPEKLWESMVADGVFSDLMGSNGGCSIPETAERAITLDQLRLIEAHVTSRLEHGPWEVTRCVGGKWLKQPLSAPEEVNLYVSRSR